MALRSTAEVSDADYVVIGGGSSGSVVAGRLAAAGAEVVVLEAGGTDRRPDVVVPAGVISAYRKLNWRYVPEPDPSRNDTVEAWAAGRVLGGGGSINATVFVRGNRADYDHWAAQGATGWDYDSVLPRFKRMESWVGGASEFRGGDGPIGVAFHSIEHPANDAFLESAVGAGHARNDDYNGASQDGVGVVQVNQRRGRRSQSSKEYLRRLAPAARCTVRTQALVRRIVLEGTRAVAVEYSHKGRMNVVRARHEVILSAGALASPKVLMLSGIGESVELERVGIEPLVTIPGVGANLQEHAAAMQRWRANFHTINHLNVRDIARAVVAYARDGRGLLAATVFHVQVMHRTDPSLEAPDIQLAFANFATTRERGDDGILKVQPHEDEGVLVSTLMLHPRSRGRVRLRSAFPEDPPVIEHALLGDAGDLHALMAGMAEGRRIMRHAPIADMVGECFEPERSCHDDQQWIEHLRDNATYGAHPVGTCRIGPPGDGVVDAELRVHGVDHLRVVDASVMPTLPSGNTNAPAMMIGELAADVILAAAGVPTDLASQESW
jgi:choline dehydrogenase